MALLSVNPATDETIARYDEHSRETSEEILRLTHAAYEQWRKMSFADRAACFNRLAAGLRENVEPLARLITGEVGKPIRDARAEVNKSAGACEYFAEHAAEFLRDEEVATDARKSYVRYEPLGVILGIMPWNFPVWQIIRYAAPVMMAGNATVLKHANNATGCALAVEEQFARAGFPEHAFRALVIDIPAVRAVIEHSLVAGVTLTGSPRAGKEVASAAGAVLKKCVLELGGSDPFVLLEDADIDAAIDAGVTSRLLVSGQVCISPKRFIVPRALAADFEQRLVARMGAAKMGDPMDEDTVYGPLARRDLRDTVARQVNESVARGANVLIGGNAVDGQGAYYPALERGHPPTTKKFLAPSRRSSSRRMNTTQSGWPTIRRTAWAPSCSAATSIARSRSRYRSRRVVVS
mgnify:CR=1 FL=1